MTELEHRTIRAYMSTVDAEFKRADRWAIFWMTLAAVEAVLLALK